MSKKKIILTVGDLTYELSTFTGAWAKSRENDIPIGTVRVIHGVLMYAWTVHGKVFGKDEVLWSPVDKEFNNHENAVKWIASYYP